jgi:hypothetical protein
MSAEDATFNVSDTPLPPPPQQHPLNPQQWSILSAIAAAVVPMLTRHDDDNDGASDRRQHHHHHHYPLRGPVYDAALHRIRTLASLDADETALAYLRESPADHAMFKESIARMVAFHMTDDARKGMLFILTALK